MKYPKTKSCLVGALFRSSFLSILFSLCSVSNLLEARGERKRRGKGWRNNGGTNAAAYKGRFTKAG
jgi:hypothetical protein